MNETDAMTLLAKANPLQAEEVMTLNVPDRFSLPERPNRRFVVAIAVVVLAATVVGVVAYIGSGQVAGPTGAKGPGDPLGPTGKPGPTGALGATGRKGPTGAFIAGTRPVTLRIHRSGATLDSVGVTVNPWVDVPVKVTGLAEPWVAKARIELSVRHGYPVGSTRHHRQVTCASPEAASCWPPYTTVYRARILVTNTSSDAASALGPTGRVGPTGRAASNDPLALSFWSGTLVPTDWTGGCHSGLYWISVRFFLPAPYATALGDEYKGAFSTKQFSCTGR